MLSHSPLSRRRVLVQAATGVAGGLLAPHLLASPELSTTRRAKACIFLFMWGGPSHLDTFDLKPNAPNEFRGPFRPIATNTPDLFLSEHFSRLAKVTDKLCVVRSMNHDDPAHLSSAHTILTGSLPPVNKSDAAPPSDKDTPHLGSVMQHLRPSPGGLPSFVTLPWLVSHPAAPGGRAPGQHGGWLGHRYDPLLLTGDPAAPGWSVPALSLMDSCPTERLTSRRQLLEAFDRQRSYIDLQGTLDSLQNQQQQAFNLLLSEKVRRAFELAAEPDPLRDRYGRNTHGQSVLLARRLVEHGVPIVQVNWHDDGRNFWDSHSDNFNRLKNDLIPPADQALAALIEDLDERGLLDETLVVWVGEFGRTPKISNGTGREHHPGCYSAVLAGGGVRGGQVYGRSDHLGLRPIEHPTNPRDLTATVYHALGVANQTTLYDELQRPHLVYEGVPMTSIFS